MIIPKHPERKQALTMIHGMAAFARMAEDVAPETQFDVSYLTHAARLAERVRDEANRAAQRWYEDHGYGEDE